MTHSAKYYVGLISGTSMDGIDAALVHFRDQDPALELIGRLLHPWPDQLKQLIQRLSQEEQISLAELGKADAWTGEVFAEAALAVIEHSGIEKSAVRAIGSHGQTLHHGPQTAFPFTLQIGDANRIAHLTGIDVVADLRRRDMAAGGQGAPLVPAFHQAVFAKCSQDRAVLNLGGIANFTLLPGTNDEPILGFDTGTANCLLDHWFSRHHSGHFDANGDWASSGQSDKDLLEQLLSDPYLALSPPKSTGTEYFSPHWLKRQLIQFPHLKPNDVQRTLLEFSAQSIADALVRWGGEKYTEVIACGGGVHNQALMQAIQVKMPKRTLTTSQAFGIEPDWVEAIAFAWLAKRHIEKCPGNAPSVTGATHPVVLGALYPA